MNEYLKLLAEVRELNPNTDALSYTVGNECISFADLQTHFSKVNEVAKRVLSTVKNDADFKVASISKRDLLISKNVRDAGYMTIRNVSVYRPSAFTGNMHDFLVLLNDSAKDILTLDSALVKFDSTLAKLVVDPEDLTKPVVHLQAVKLPDAEKLVNKFQDFFMGRSGLDEVPLKNIYGSIKQIDATSEYVHKLTEKFNGSDVQNIRMRGDALYKTLEYLEDELETRGLKMTDKWRKAIGKELYVVTQWLAIYSMFITKLVAASVAHRDSLGKLNSI